MPRVLLLALMLVGAPQLFAQPRPPVNVPPPTPAPVLAPIPRATLEAMYQAELGPRYNRDVAPFLYDAHGLLEKYFAAGKADERKAVLEQLGRSGVSPSVLGRIARLRMHWPELEAGVYYINERVGPHAILYFLGVPNGYDRTRAWPLVIKLPGAHAFITDPPPTADQVVEIYSGWIREELGKHPEALVLMPLLNMSELWGPSYKGMNTVLQPMYHAAGRVNVDPARVYLLGQGMGAHATWNFALHYPTYFAAINPMAGGASSDWQRLRLRNLRNVFPVVWHDADDPMVKVESSRDVVKILRAFKYDVDYEETSNVGHAPTDEIAERLYQKMRKRTRELYPTEVAIGSNRPDTIFNRGDWLQVYQSLKPGQELKKYLSYGSGTMTFQQNPFAIQAAITGPNRIEIESQNVQSMRVYVNDAMVDFSKPVTVLVNKKPRFEGVVQESFETMLLDQVFLGRGWRYFTGAIDIDFGTMPVDRPSGTTQPTTRTGKITVYPSSRGR